MAVTNLMLSLKQNIQQMLDTLSLLADRDWLVEGRKRLRKLYQKVEALSLALQSKLSPRLEMEFYSIIESHPKLRQASQVVFKEELVGICEEGLSYYAELRRARSLTTRELEQLRNVEEEYQRATKELDQLRQVLLERFLFARHTAYNALSRL